MPVSKYTPAAWEKIAMMARDGATVGEIAEAIGTTQDSLRMTCSKLGISLRSFRANKELVRLPLLLTDDTYRAVQRRADASGKSMAGLVADLIEVIARDNIFDAVLDA